MNLKSKSKYQCIRVFFAFYLWKKWDKYIIKMQILTAKVIFSARRSLIAFYRWKLYPASLHSTRVFFHVPFLQRTFVNNAFDCCRQSHVSLWEHSVANFATLSAAFFVKSAFFSRLCAIRNAERALDPYRIVRPRTLMRSLKLRETFATAATPLTEMRFPDRISTSQGKVQMGDYIGEANKFCTQHNGNAHPHFAHGVCDPVSNIMQLITTIYLMASAWKAGRPHTRSNFCWVVLCFQARAIKLLKLINGHENSPSNGNGLFQHTYRAVILWVQQ